MESPKSIDLKQNPKASMCFYWKSLRRQVRILGYAKQVDHNKADDYFNTRPYGSRIGAWASRQSSIMKERSEIINSIEKFKIKYADENKVPRPPYWSGWVVNPQEIEFWLDRENRIHERLRYQKKNKNWKKDVLYP